MKQTVGTLIRQARAKRNLTREQAAKKLKISTGYLGHLECDKPVHLSDGLIEKMISKIGVSKKLGALQDSHNKRMKRATKDYPSNL